METLPSSEFRKRYASLERDTLVTVNGHAIGRWTPIGYADEVMVDGPSEPARVVRQWDRYDQRPLRAAPKPGK